MKNTFLTLTAIAALIESQCFAEVVVEEFSFTTSSITVSLSGTLEGPTPAFNRDFLFFASEEPNDDFYFLTQLTSGSLTVDSDLKVGNDEILFMGFDHSSTGQDQINIGSNGFFFASGDIVSGTATFNFLEGYADLNNLSMPALYWGRAGQFTSPTSGTFQVAIPEPSIIAYMLAFLFLTPLIRRNKRSNQSR